VTESQWGVSVVTIQRGLCVTSTPVLMESHQGLLQSTCCHLPCNRAVVSGMDLTNKQGGMCRKGDIATNDTHTF
jgi:hypothetical protein